ncbi:prephenate dehydratase [Salinimicrobium catena]|uniref:prephenate dehydratase n=1 Tax=Salinimicrobium catena TaxID=390640 RepID=A0A1H5P0Q6_9FLAO|nr:prephenate dehydratase [Salinimicrobium catena]SDL63258.1 prephenate dehydratase [Salinimicrobium catena]SEF07260.1 prephenate dehydratase [Salinimicrobium catena]
MKEKVAIQGIAGSFHHQVAREYFGNEVQVEECMTFQSVIDSLRSGTSEKAVMAIENSIAGSILPNYALIDDNEISITGEHYIPIQMNLMAVPGQSIQEIKKVYSHPMALLQCKEFFRHHPHIKLIEDADTASVAKRISENGKKGVAAVASSAAAELFNLEIIERNIHTVKSNTTRFLILSATAKEQQSDKASIKFVMESRQGSLVSALNILRDYELDMTKIQSVPVIEMPWKYAFFIDVIFTEPDNFKKAMQILELMTEQLKVLGAYKNGNAAGKRDRRLALVEPRE